MSARQGSASYTIVIGVFAAFIVGAILLTMLFYPIMDAMMGSAFWNAETTAGSRMLTYTGGLWKFWGAIILLALLAFVWIRTRQ